MTALICGSMAYDTVMTFEGRFHEHILPDRIHALNVSFLAPSMRYLGPPKTRQRCCVGRGHEAMLNPRDGVCPVNDQLVPAAAPARSGTFSRSWLRNGAHRWHDCAAVCATRLCC